VPALLAGLVEGPSLLARKRIAQISPRSVERQLIFARHAKKTKNPRGNQDEIRAR
jgi:hypothetical protein